MAGLFAMKMDLPCFLGPIVKNKAMSVYLRGAFMRRPSGFMGAS
ncbi:hypothetical protein [Desulfosarcina cetonica]